jgi:membrane protease YdiL (CAAX protease family)
VAWLVAALIGAGHTASEPIGEMVAGARISLAPLVAMSIVNGIYEEVFLLGYLQRALEGFGAAFAVGVSLLVRLLYHLYQGPSGALYVLGFGLVLSLYFLRTGKLWPVAFAHIFADFAGFSTS